MVEIFQVVLLGLSLLATVVLKRPVVCEAVNQEVKCYGEACEDVASKVALGLPPEGE